MTSFSLKRVFSIFLLLHSIISTATSSPVTSAPVTSSSNQTDSGWINSLVHLYQTMYHRVEEQMTNDTSDDDVISTRRRSPSKEEEILMRSTRFATISRDHKKLELRRQIYYLYHKLSGRFVVVNDNGSVSLVDEKTRQTTLLFLTKIPKKDATVTSSDRHVILRIYSPTSKLFLALRKRGKLYGTPNPKDKNTKFFHEYFPNSHDAYRSVKHGSYVAMGLRGSKPRRPVRSNLTESAEFLAMLSDVSPGNEILALFPSLRHPNLNRCQVLKGVRFRRCKQAAKKKKKSKRKRHHKRPNDVISQLVPSRPLLTSSPTQNT